MLKQPNNPKGVIRHYCGHGLGCGILTNIMPVYLQCLEENYFYAFDDNTAIGRWSNYFEKLHCEKAFEKAQKKTKCYYKIFNWAPESKSECINKINTTELPEENIQCLKEGQSCELPININFERDAAHKTVDKEVLNQIYRIIPSIQREINANPIFKILPDCFDAFHVRRGDRIANNHLKPKSLQQYFEIYENQNIYIATDDYSVIEEAKNLRPDLNFYFLVQEEKRGYFHRKESIKHEETIQSLTDIEICSMSDRFIGTAGSCYSRLIQLRHKKGDTLLV